MKRPDEIKKGLECCKVFGGCSECPYATFIEFPYGAALSCTGGLNTDSLAYIQQLERERDALLDALKKADVYGECGNCKHRDSAPSDCDCECGSCQRNCRCWECRDGDNWEWVGVKEDDK